MTKERAEKFAPILARYPGLIVNNRLCPGMDGDLETPEQFIPATGFPGKNWESCMTMNTTWGYSSWDHNWKSAEVLVRNLIDIASKGGNYLINVGPTAEGLIPDASVGRLKEIGAWMKTNGEAIYGTSPSPFKRLDWGRCTIKKVGGKNLVYLHIFDFPEDGILRIPGLSIQVDKAWPLKSKDQELKVEKAENYMNINVSGIEREKFATVIALETKDEVVVYNAPEISAEYSIFIDKASFSVNSDIPGCILRYTVDGSIPTNESAKADGTNMVMAKSSFVVRSLCFLDGKPVSGVSEKKFDREEPIPATNVLKSKPGVNYEYYEGSWGQLPEFSTLKPLATGIVQNIDLAAKKRKSDYGMVFKGFIRIPETGVYQFVLTSNDGSKMIVSGKTLSNDGLHGFEGKSMDIALARGLHPIEIQYFQAGGGDALKLEWKTGGNELSILDPASLVH
jgi:alpha-L-fucosidase